VTHLPSAPGLLVSGIPRALGYDPVGSAVLVGLAGHTPNAAVIIGADVDDDPATTADALMMAARLDGAQEVAVVVYADDAPDTSSQAAQTAAAVVLRAERHHLHVLDALWVSSGRYASYLCTEPACCPPGGSPIPTPSEETP
jgi:hypothetical protein